MLCRSNPFQMLLSDRSANDTAFSQAMLGITDNKILPECARVDPGLSLLHYFVLAVDCAVQNIAINAGTSYAQMCCVWLWGLVNV